MAVAHLLHGIRRKNASRVHGPLVDLVPTQFRHRTAFRGRESARPATASIAAERVTIAESSLRVRHARIAVLRRDLPRRGTLIVVDDIVTTGATLAAVTSRLREVEVQVEGAAVVAATRLRRAARTGFAGLPPGGTDGHGQHGHHLRRSPNEG